MRNREGITLTELVVSIGIIGLMAFMLPILVKLFNNLGYLQQKNLIQTEARSVLWQMSHEARNAVRIDVPGGPGCQVYNAALPAQAANFNCMSIWVYDYEQYGGDGIFETPFMYLRCVDRDGSPLVREEKNFGQIIYEVVNDAGGKPYLSKKILWGYDWVRPDGTTRPANGAEQVFFKDRIAPPNHAAVKVFSPQGAPPPVGGGQVTDKFFKAVLKLRTSYDQASTPFRFFSTMLTQSGQREVEDPRTCP